MAYKCFAKNRVTEASSRINSDSFKTCVVNKKSDELKKKKE